MAFSGINIAENVVRSTQRIDFATYAATAPYEGLTSVAGWSFAGLILTARTGLDYRRLQRNEIDQGTFNRNLRQNTAESVGSVVGGCVGVAIGVPIGGLFL